MPIYEYQCKGCGNQFELLVRSDTAIACPSCGSAKVKKRLSVFAAHRGRKETVPSCHTGMDGCDLGKCGSGFCGAK